MAELYRFAAFISYSSRDATFARRLHKALEQYRIPKSLGSFDLLGEGGKANRIYPVFRDREELSAGDLGERIEAALRASSALIVVCTPDSAASPWVKKEIEYFRTLGRAGRVFTIIPEAAPSLGANDDPRTCFPSTLASGREPLAADARRTRDGFRGALLKVVAGLIDVNAGALADRDRASRRLRLLQRVALVVFAFGVFGLGGSLLVSNQLQQRSSALAELARQASEQGFYDRAARYARVGLRGSDWPLLGFEAAAAEAELRRALMAPRRLVLSGHTASVGGAVFSPDGNEVLTESSDGTSRVWDAQSGRLIATLSGGFSAFSPDGSRVVTADGAQAHIWEAASGREVRSLSGHDPSSSVYAVSFSPDGSRIVTRANNETTIIWDAQSGREIRRMVDIVHAISSDGDRIVTGSEDGAIRISDLASGDELLVLTGHECGIASAEFSSDQAYILATAACNGTARVWRLADGHETLMLHGAYGATFSLDGSRIATGTHVWDTRTGEQVAELRGHESHLRTTSFSRDGTRILTASDDGTARIWDVVSGRELALLRGHEGIVWTAAFSPDGTRVVTASEDGTARIWDASGSGEIALVRSYGANVTQAGFSYDGRLLITSSDTGSARIWDVASGRLQTTLPGDREDALCASFSPDGARAITVSYHLFSRVWDVANGRAIQTLRGDQAMLSCRPYSPDGSRFLTINDDDLEIRVWEVGSGDRIATLRGHERPFESGIFDAVFSPDGARVLTTGADQTARVWDAASGRELLTLRGHEGYVSRASYSRDGALIATAGGDNTARLWNSATGSEFAVLRGHAFPLKDVSFSGDGDLIITAASDGTARIWDIESGREIALLRLSERTGEVQNASFRPNVSEILVVSQGRAQLWALPRVASASRRELMEMACIGPLVGGAALFSEAELRAAPYLHPQFDANACSPINPLALLPS